MALLQFTAVTPGIGGNLVLMNLIFAGSGPLAAAVVTPGLLNQVQIDVTVNISLVPPSTWADVAAALNADPAVAAVVTAFGDADTIQTNSGFQRLTAGTTGQG